jgi:hypothetical protein
VFFGVSLLLHRKKEKEKCQLFSVSQSKREERQKTEKRHSERNFEEFIIEREYNTNNTNNGQRTFETFRGGGGKG